MRREPKQPPLNARNRPEMSDGGDWQRVSPDVNCDVQRELDQRKTFRF